MKKFMLLMMLASISTGCINKKDGAEQAASISMENKQSTAYSDKTHQPVAKVLAVLQENMVTIPAGSFQMGSEHGDANEKPIHTVHVKSFKIGKYEVTQAQWQAVMGDNPSSFLGMNKPVESVNWHDVQAFIKKLNKLSNKHYRLPSEAEWEYAARAGSVGQFSWGNDVGQNNANCKSCGSQWDNKMTAPVGSFQPNGFGLYDMHGNVWEWVADFWHNDYSGAPADGRVWLSDVFARYVLRGGSWGYAPSRMHLSFRTWTSPDDRLDSIGFRLAQDE